MIRKARKGDLFFVNHRAGIYYHSDKTDYSLTLRDYLRHLEFLLFVNYDVGPDGHTYGCFLRLSTQEKIYLVPDRTYEDNLLFAFVEGVEFYDNTTV